MGRSAGNTQTEILLSILEKKGINTHIDRFKAMDVGENIIRPRMKKDQGVDALGISSGIAQFHSSFTHIVQSVAQKYHLDLRRLIEEVSKINKVSITSELVEQVAQKLLVPEKDIKPEFTFAPFDFALQFPKKDYKNYC